METQADKCARCMENGLEDNEDCEFYGEPNGCNAPVVGEYPKPRNAVEMSGALEAIAESARTGSISTLTSASLVLKTCEDALKKPPRNCDIGTPDEQCKRFEHYCLEHFSRGRRCENCPLKSAASCEFAWAQLPYRREEA